MKSSKGGAVKTIKTGIVLASLTLFCFFGVRQYESLVGPPDYGYEKVGEAISRNLQDDEVVFVEYAHGFEVRHPDAWEEPYPATMLYAHRNLAAWIDEKLARQIANQDGFRARR